MDSKNQCFCFKDCTSSRKRRAPAACMVKGMIHDIAGNFGYCRMLHDSLAMKFSLRRMRLKAILGVSGSSKWIGRRQQQATTLIEKASCSCSRPFTWYYLDRRLMLSRTRNSKSGLPPCYLPVRKRKVDEMARPPEVGHHHDRDDDSEAL